MICHPLTIPASSLRVLLDPACPATRFLGFVAEFSCQRAIAGSFGILHSPFNLLEAHGQLPTRSHAGAGIPNLEESDRGGDICAQSHSRRRCAEYSWQQCEPAGASPWWLGAVRVCISETAGLPVIVVVFLVKLTHQDYCTDVDHGPKNGGIIFFLQGRIGHGG